MNWDKLARAAEDAGYPPEFTDYIKKGWSNDPAQQCWSLMGAITAVGLHVVEGSSDARLAGGLFRILAEAYTDAHKRQTC